MDDTTEDLIRRRAENQDYTWQAQDDVTALLAEVSRLQAERDTLAAELDTERHEYTPGGTYGGCSWRRSSHAHTDCGQLEEDREHRTARVVLADRTGE